MISMPDPQGRKWRVDPCGRIYPAQPVRFIPEIQRMADRMMLDARRRAERRAR